MKLSIFCALAAPLLPATTAAPWVDPVTLGLWYKRPTSGPDDRALAGDGNMKNPRGPVNVVGVFEFDMNAGKGIGESYRKEFTWSSDKSKYPLQQCFVWLSSHPQVNFPYYSLKNGTVFTTASTGNKLDTNSIHVKCDDIV